MAVVNGTPVDASTTNAALASKTANNTLVGVQALANTNPSSGATVTNLQQAINETFDAVGMTGTGDINRNDYSSNEVISDGDNRKEAIEKLDAQFALSGGHSHSGNPGDGSPIPFSSLSGFNGYWLEWQNFSFDGAAGTSDDVSTPLLGKTPGGTSTLVGVLTDPPNNRVEVVEKDTLTYIEDAGGQRVYGRLTESVGVWTLSYFTNEAGVETAHSLATQNIRVLFREVFDSATRPTIPSNPMEWGTLDVTADVVDASATERGVVSTGMQSFAGAKEFQGNLSAVAKVSFDQLVDSTTTGSAQTLSNPTKAVIVLTDPGLVSLTGVTVGPDSQAFVLMNETTVPVLILNDVGTASERFITGTGADLTLEVGASIFVCRDDNAARWKVVGGTGGGGAESFHKTEKLRIVYTDLVAQGAVASTITVPYTIPDSCVLKSVTAKVQTAFTFGSGTPTDLLIDVGNNGSPIAYIESFDLLAQPAGAFESAMTSNTISLSPNNNIVVQISISGGATLDEISAGLLDVYVEYYDSELAPIDATLAMS